MPCFLRLDGRFSVWFDKELWKMFWDQHMRDLSVITLAGFTALCLRSERLGSPSVCRPKMNLSFDVGFSITPR